MPERAGGEHAGAGTPPQGSGPLRTLVLALLAVPALAALAFVVLGLLAGPPPATVVRPLVAPWRTTVGDAASAAGFAVTVAGLVLVVRAGQVGARRTGAAELVDTLDAERRRDAAAALAGRGPTPAGTRRAARALALVRAARWTVMVLFAGLLLTAAGRSVVVAEPAALAGPGTAVVVLSSLLVVLDRQRRSAQAYLLHHPDRRTPPAVAAALARWTGGARA